MMDSIHKLMIACRFNGDLKRQHYPEWKAMPLYFEDIEIDRIWMSEEYPITREEVIDFASRWDPQPFHLDEAAAAESIFGKLTASAAHTFAIQGYLNSTLEKLAMIAGLGVTKFEVHHPVFPGDRLRLQRRVISKHISRSKSDRGIILFECLTINQDNEVVLETRNKLMIHCISMD